MTTAALKAFGTLLKRGNGATPEVFTTIAEVYGLTGPELAMDTVDVTTHDSTDGMEEHIGTILRTGTVKFNLNFNPVGATHTVLMDDLKNRILRNFQMVLSDPGTTTFAFSGLVTGFSISEDEKDRLIAAVTIKISGAWTLS